MRACSRNYSICILYDVMLRLKLELAIKCCTRVYEYFHDSKFQLLLCWNIVELGARNLIMLQIFVVITLNYVLNNVKLVVYRIWTTLATQHPISYRSCLNFISQINERKLPWGIEIYGLVFIHVINELSSKNIDNKWSGEVKMMCKRRKS